MEISSLPDEELKVRVTNMLANLGKRINELSENFNKEIENIRKYQTEVITEMKNTLEGFSSRLDDVEEPISELKDKTMELTQIEKQKEKKNLKK